MAAGLPGFERFVGCVAEALATAAAAAAADEAAGIGAHCEAAAAAEAADEEEVEIVRVVAVFAGWTVRLFVAGTESGVDTAAVAAAAAAGVERPALGVEPGFRI